MLVDAVVTKMHKHLADSLLSPKHPCPSAVERPPSCTRARPTVALIPCCTPHVHIYNRTSINNGTAVWLCLVLTKWQLCVLPGVPDACLCRWARSARAIAAKCQSCVRPLCIAHTLQLYSMIPPCLTASTQTSHQQCT